MGRFSVLLLWFVAVSSWATIDAYQFENSAQEQQFRQLIAELRCPKCQNQNISDSDADLSKDLKDRVHQLILAGKNNREITAYMVERYGNFITYRPPVEPATYFLWFGPVLIAMLVAAGLIVSKLTSGGKSAAKVTDGQQEKVDRLLQSLADQEQSSTQQSDKTL